MNNAILTEKISDALIVKFNRPEIRSPLSVFVLNRLDELLDETAKTLEIKKIIFTGKENVFASVRIYGRLPRFPLTRRTSLQSEGND